MRGSPVNLNPASVAGTGFQFVEVARPLHGLGLAPAIHAPPASFLQKPSRRIHTLVQDSDYFNRVAPSGTVEDHMATVGMLPVTGANLAAIPTQTRLFGQPVKGLVELLEVTIALAHAPALLCVLGDDSQIGNRASAEPKAWCHLLAGVQRCD